MSLPPNKNLLAEYPNRYFVESGSYRGDAIQQALDAGFQQIRSMDIDKENVVFCHHRFDLYRGKYPNVLVKQGDSSTDFFQLFGGVQEQITFFLDAHWQMLDGTDPGANPFPLLKELEQIGAHSIKSHTLIIDDWHIFYPDRVGYSKEDVKRAVLQINPNYKFTFAANPVIDGILIVSI